MLDAAASKLAAIVCSMRGMKKKKKKKAVKAFNLSKVD